MTYRLFRNYMFNPLKTFGGVPSSSIISFAIETNVKIGNNSYENCKIGKTRKNYATDNSNKYSYKKYSPRTLFFALASARLATQTSATRSREISPLLRVSSPEICRAPVGGLAFNPPGRTIV